MVIPGHRRHPTLGTLGLGLRLVLGSAATPPLGDTNETDAREREKERVERGREKKREERERERAREEGG